MSRRVEYYDDEDLDRYAGTPPGSYTPAQVEEFREVFYTMQEADVPGWVRSLQLRGIALPDELRDEVLLVVGRTPSGGFASLVFLAFPGRLFPVRRVGAPPFATLSLFMDLLQYTFFQNALLGSLLASIACGLVGTYIVARRLVFISGGADTCLFRRHRLGALPGGPRLC